LGAAASELERTEDSGSVTEGARDDAEANA
jgi:hypothetical protein